MVWRFVICNFFFVIMCKNKSIAKITKQSTIGYDSAWLIVGNFLLQIYLQFIAAHHVHFTIHFIYLRLRLFELHINITIQNLKIYFNKYIYIYILCIESSALTRQTGGLVQLHEVRLTFAEAFHRAHAVPHRIRAVHVVTTTRTQIWGHHCLCRRRPGFQHHRSHDDHHHQSHPGLRKR